MFTGSSIINSVSVDLLRVSDPVWFAHMFAATSCCPRNLHGKGRVVKKTPETQIVENTQVNRAPFRFVLVETMVASYCSLFIDCYLWLLHCCGQL